MLPAMLGLGGLTAKVIATAVIPGVVRAIRQSFSTTRAPEACPSPPVEGISSGPEPAPAPVLSGVSGTRIRSRKWGYAGLWHHQASGLDLATYRLYDAANKRWISRDPLGESSDFTLYSYCGNNPISFLDPEGLDRIYASADAHSTPNGSIRIQIDYGYEGLDPSTVVIGAEAVVTARMRNRPTPMQVNEGPANVPLSTNVRPGDLVLNSRILLPRLRPGKSDYTNQTIPTKTPGKPAGTGYRELEVTVRIIPPKDYAEVPGQEVFLVIYEITKEGCLGRVKFRYPKKEQRSKAQR